MYKTKQSTPADVTLWLQQNINDKELVFDKCADLFDIIVKKLQDDKIHISVENNILMIKLCKYLYDNSCH
jgi:hypothetical protein